MGYFHSATRKPSDLTGVEVRLDRMHELDGEAGKKRGLLIASISNVNCAQIQTTFTIPQHPRSSSSSAEHDPKTASPFDFDDIMDSFSIAVGTAGPADVSFRILSYLADIKKASSKIQDAITILSQKTESLLAINNSVEYFPHPRRNLGNFDAPMDHESDVDKVWKFWH